MIPDIANLVMQKKQNIQCVNELCPTNKNALHLNTVNDLNCRLNNLCAELSYSDCKSLSVLFRTYFMNVYGSQKWAHSKNYLNKFYITYRKEVIRILKQPDNS